MRSHTLLRSAVGLLAALPSVLGQVTTDCNPMNKTCPPDPAFGMDFNFNFNTTPKADAWETTAGTVSYSPDKGAIFTINKQGDSPTIRTKFYFFFGRTEVHLKAATGRGIISSMMWLSDNLDEVDWEFFGTNNTHGQSNYFGKGLPDFRNAIYHPMSDVHNEYHNYTTLWTKDMLQWFIDGKLVRTLLPKDANNTLYYPQTPMRLSLGIWAGGDPSLPKGTREWAGGDTDYSKGPFTMFVKSVQVTDFSQGKEYVFSDRSGSWQSIKIVEGNSTVKEVILAPPPETFTDKWNNLSPTAKTAIYASGAGLGAALFFFALWYCIKQRRRGAREAKIAAAKAEEERLELERYKKAGINPDALVESGAEYDAKEMRKEGMAHRDSWSVPASPATPVNSVGVNGNYNEKSWDSAAAGAAVGGLAGANAMRSPVPLLQNGAQSPRVASPGPNSHGPYSAGGMPMNSNNGSHLPAHMQPPVLVSPLRTPSPGGPPNFPPPASPNMGGHRSASTPNTYMRMGSPGPQQGYGAPRLQSPAPMNAPMNAPPARSFSAPRQHQGYGAQTQGYNSNQSYWDQGGYR